MTYLHVDSYEDPGAFLAYGERNARGRHRLRPLAVQPVAVARRPKQPVRPARRGRRPTCTCRSSPTNRRSPNSPDVQSAEVTLPEGMTLEPSAAHGLVACSDAQFARQRSRRLPGGLESRHGARQRARHPQRLAERRRVRRRAGNRRRDRNRAASTACSWCRSARSTGSGCASKAASAPNAQSGRLTASFSGAPQVPFEDFMMHFNGGARAPLANPLSCGRARPERRRSLPYSGEPPEAAATSGFRSRHGARRLRRPAAVLAGTELTPPNPAQAGAFSPFTLNLARGDGQQYLSQVTVTLPPGLRRRDPLGAALRRRRRPAPAPAPPASQIGTVAVAAGAGSEPYAFTGQRLPDGPLRRRPLRAVDRRARGRRSVRPRRRRHARGDRGRPVQRARDRVTATLPSVVGGVPLRLQKPERRGQPAALPVQPDELRAAGERIGCCTSTLRRRRASRARSRSPTAARWRSSRASARQRRRRPRKPAARASKSRSRSRPTRRTSASCSCSCPSTLPSRADDAPESLPGRELRSRPAARQLHSRPRVSARVTVTTPVLPGTLTGPAYLVSHGGDAFPDLDLVLRGDGVEVVLVGHTHISPLGHHHLDASKACPTCRSRARSSTCPSGPTRLLTANGRLCAQPCWRRRRSSRRAARRLTPTRRSRSAAARCACSRTELAGHTRDPHRVGTRSGAPQRQRPWRQRRDRGASRRRGTLTLSVPLTGACCGALHTAGTARARCASASAGLGQTFGGLAERLLPLRGADGA